MCDVHTLEDRTSHAAFTGRKTTCDVFKTALSLFCVLWLAIPVRGASIDVGTHVLPADSSGVVQIYLEPGDPVEEIAGMNLVVQIGDGGPEVGGSIDGPDFVGADIVAKTIFGADPMIFLLDIPAPQLLVGAITLATSGTSVAADGLLVTMEIDTTGFIAGSWDLKLMDTVVPAGTEILDNSTPNPQVLPVTIMNGFIEIISQLLPGDYNQDGSVNAADYTVWRDGLDTVFSPDDYDLWKMNYGSFNGNSPLSRQPSILLPVAVPEPGGLPFACLGLLGHGILRSRARSKRSSTMSS